MPLVVSVYTHVQVGRWPTVTLVRTDISVDGELQMPDVRMRTPEQDRTGNRMARQPVR